MQVPRHLNEGIPSLQRFFINIMMINSPKVINDNRMKTIERCFNLPKGINQYFRYSSFAFNVNALRAKELQINYSIVIKALRAKEHWMIYFIVINALRAKELQINDSIVIDALWAKM